MAKYHNKPVVIEARQFDGGWESTGRAIVKWAPPVGFGTNAHSAWLEVRTAEGTMRADPGDWIVKGVKGELYPIKDAIFRETYEPVN